MGSDRNFDDLALQFSQRIYATAKGRIRLAVLERDLEPIVAGSECGRVPLAVLDAGCGQGQMALQLAARGHRVTCCDLSPVMLEQARSAADSANLASRMQFVLGPIQALTPVAGGYQLILCHAVLEWVADWRGLLRRLQGLLAPGGHLSLMFYNRHGTRFRRLLRGYFQAVNEDRLEGSGQGLTPLHPLDPATVLDQLQQMGMRVCCRSGVRVFHDYMAREIRERRSEADIVALELRFSQEEPYRSLGRYYHVLVQAGPLPPSPLEVEEES
ncbi:MAG: methyltransferase domain-containing protein [Pseudomonadota bacterium]|nr:methyltransferase domain-containing protein [Pseudomonadota bacterium]